MTKITLATHGNSVLAGEVRRVLVQQPSLVDTRKYVGPARAAVHAEAARLLALALVALHDPAARGRCARGGPLLGLPNWHAGSRDLGEEG